MPQRKPIMHYVFDEMSQRTKTNYACINDGTLLDT